MLLHNFKKIGLWCLSILISVVFYTAPYSIASDDIEYNYNKLIKALGNLPQPDGSKKSEAYITKILQFLSETSADDDTKTQALMKQWDDHLLGIKDFSSTEHFLAIVNQQSDYYKAITDLNDRIKETNNYRKQYSSAWIDDLINHFGKDFLQNNRTVIIDNFGAIMAWSYHHYVEELKDLIYIETMLYGSYKEYFGMFIQFYNEELDDEGRKKLKTRKDVAESFLSIIYNASFTKMHETLVLTEKMADNRAKKLNEELFHFFKEHPLSRNFNLSKAGNDLDKAIQGEKVE